MAVVGKGMVSHTQLNCCTCANLCARSPLVQPSLNGLWMYWGLGTPDLVEPKRYDFSGHLPFRTAFFLISRWPQPYWLFVRPWWPGYALRDRVGTLVEPDKLWCVPVRCLDYLLWSFLIAFYFLLYWFYKLGGEGGGFAPYVSHTESLVEDVHHKNDLHKYINKIQHCICLLFWIGITLPSPLPPRNLSLENYHHHHLILRT